MSTRTGKSGVLAVVLAATAAAFAFNPPEATEGPLKVSIVAPDVVRTLDDPFEVQIDLETSGTATLDARLEVWVADDFRIGPSGQRRIEQPVRLAAGAKERIALKVTAGSKGTYNAHYPIHARVTFNDPNTKEKRAAHAIKILVVDAPRPAATVEPTRVEAGTTALWRMPTKEVALALGQDGTTQTLGQAWRGSDQESGATFQVTSTERGGRSLPCLAVHPPYRKGWGVVWADYDLILPDARPITLSFSTAIRDNAEKEPPSDGVEFRVLAGAQGQPLKPLFGRFTKSKTWEEASVDLSQFAGRRITLRLWAGPGPANNTVCDSGYWGNPFVNAGKLPARTSPEDRARRRLAALQVAGDARKGPQRGPQWGWQLRNDAGTFGVAFLPGPQGLVDAVVAIAGEKGNLCSDGFQVEIDGTELGAIPVADGGDWKSTFSDGRAVTEAQLFCGGKTTRVRATVWIEGGALRCAFSMPGVERDKRGHPRFTLLGLGPLVDVTSSSQTVAGAPKARRVYAGFGNVVEKPGRFDLRSDGFNLSTRHVGVDFDNGISLVQACDVFPDQFHIDPQNSIYALQTHHDATISLIPSEKGAFAAARVYREGIAGFKPAPGLDRLQGRMCLDYWGTSYQHGIDTVEQLARYGVTDCVYVWHNWQRWGYDYRLPEIYPARDDHALFVRLAETCRKHGILFSPHDNYIDFYPDAEGYSYDHIIFNEDGTPQKAWFNKGRNAQSYRWLPHAFRPWLEKNIALLKQDVKPDAYFIDVFTAIRPMDYYDSQGRFYSKTETIRHWGECFDYVREQFDGAPQICEAGHDTQIGHVAAGQSDHMGVVRGGTGQWAWNVPCADGERTPWHDMASHGSFILFAGGLANRYVGGLDRRAHGYGSDDYLSLTVLGGRNPMAHGDASAETIRTYWLLHDICAELGKRPMTSHEFGDGNIHRQIVWFGDNAAVRVNRGEDDWQYPGWAVAKGAQKGQVIYPTSDGKDVILPPYGFVALAGECYADVMRRDGVVGSYAESPAAIFADARPATNAQRRVIDFGPVATNGAFRLVRGKEAWQILLLPGCPPCEIQLKPDRITGLANARAQKVERLTPEGKIAGNVAFEQADGAIVFHTAAGDFGFRVR